MMNMAEFLRILHLTYRVVGWSICGLIVGGKVAKQVQRLERLRRKLRWR